MPKNLTNEQRSKVLWYLQQHKNPANKNGLKRGALESAAIDFQVSAKTVKRVWSWAAESEGIADSRIKGRSGRKQHDRTVKFNLI